MENNKYIKEKEAINMVCPFHQKGKYSCMCDGQECMAWKWTGYKVVYKEDKNNTTDQINTHGCCGLVYTNNTTLKVEYV